MTQHKQKIVIIDGKIYELGETIAGDIECINMLGMKSAKRRLKPMA